MLNVWVAPAGDLAAAKPVTNDRKRGIRQHFWAYDGAHVLYLQDQGGDENWRLYSARADGGGERDLTPLPGVQAQVIGLSHERPGTVLVGLNDRKPEWHDAYEIDIASGERDSSSATTRRSRAISPDSTSSRASRCARCPTAARCCAARATAGSASWPTGRPTA